VVENQFKELGFTDRETRVYLALIELGSSTVGPISKKTKLQPSKIYETIEKLIEKGLVSYTLVSKTKHFQASNPREIIKMIDNKKKRFEEVVKALEEKQKSREEKQVSVIHEGHKSFRALFNLIADNLTSKDYYYAFAFGEEYHSESASILLHNFHKKLGKKKVDDRAIGNLKYKKIIRRAFKDVKNYKLRFTKNVFPSGMLMYKDRTIHLIWGERPTAIEIISEQVNERYRKFFLELWGKSSG